MQPQEIKPCPFCGYNKIFVPLSVHNIYVTKCLGCGACGPMDSKKTQRQAIEAWNERK